MYSMAEIGIAYVISRGRHDGQYSAFVRES